MNNNKLKIQVPDGFKLGKYDEKTGEIEILPIVKDITTIVHDIESLCKYLNITEKELFIYPKDTIDKHERFINACNIIPKVSIVYNDGTELGEKEWKNSSIYKYCPYKYFSSGSGSVVFVTWLSVLVFPGGFYLKNQKLAESHYNNFTKYWEDYWQIKS